MEKRRKWLVVSSILSFSHDVFKKAFPEKLLMCALGFTLSQTTNVRLFQAGKLEVFADDIFKLDENGRISLKR